MVVQAGGINGLEKLVFIRQVSKAVLVRPRSSQVPGNPETRRQGAAFRVCTTQLLAVVPYNGTLQQLSKANRVSTTLCFYLGGRYGRFH